jgi:hypothetical protein
LNLRRSALPGSTAEAKLKPYLPNYSATRIRPTVEGYTSEPPLTTPPPYRSRRRPRASAQLPSLRPHPPCYLMPLAATPAASARRSGIPLSTGAGARGPRGRAGEQQGQREPAASLIARLEAQATDLDAQRRALEEALRQSESELAALQADLRAAQAENGQLKAQLASSRPRTKRSRPGSPP